MTDLLPFVIIGLATGSVYGMAAMGLVLTYQTSGIFNFAHGAVAALAAFAFYELHSVRGLPWPVALVVAVIVLPPIVAFVLERLLRGLAGAGVTMKIVATVGLQLAITGALIAHYGAAGLDFPAFLPTGAVELAGINVGIDQLISAGIGAAGALGFFLFFKMSTLGVRMRAVVDNPELLSLAGTNPFAVRSWAWLIGCHFAAISGVLLAPQIGLDALLLTLLVVQAYGAAAVGLFSSLPLTYAGGLLIGVLAALATNLVSGSEVLAGLPPAMPFLVLFVVLLLAGKRRLVELDAAPSAGAPPRASGGGKLLALAAVAAGIALPMLVGSKLPVYANALVLILVFAGLYLLVCVSGQVSLAHAGLVAVGSAAFSHLAVGAGLPWLLAVLLAGAIAVPVGALVAIPAIRLSGLYLALATFGFGLLLENVGYRTDWMFGSTGSQPSIRPALFAGDTAFYYVLLAFAVGVLVLIGVIGRSRLGRLLRGLADSPTTLSTLGLGVNVTRVTVFGLSAFIAGVAGALHASLGHSATGAPFTSFVSLSWLAVLILSGAAGSAAPVVAAIGLGVVPAYIADETLVAWLPVAFGLGALLVTTRGTSADGQPASGPSRAAERIGAPGPAAARTTAPRLDSGPARVRVGVALSRGGGR